MVESRVLVRKNTQFLCGELRSWKTGWFVQIQYKNLPVKLHEGSWRELSQGFLIDCQLNLEFQIYLKCYLNTLMYSVSPDWLKTLLDQFHGGWIGATASYLGKGARWGLGQLANSNSYHHIELFSNICISIWPLLWRKIFSIKLWDQALAKGCQKFQRESCHHFVLVQVKGMILIIWLFLHRELYKLNIVFLYNTV